jgi:hypothetical protein
LQGGADRLDLAAGVVDGPTATELVRDAARALKGMTDVSQHRGHGPSRVARRFVADSIDHRHCGAATGG